MFGFKSMMIRPSLSTRIIVAGSHSLWDVDRNSTWSPTLYEPQSGAGAPEPTPEPTEGLRFIIGLSPLPDAGRPPDGLRFIIGEAPPATMGGLPLALPREGLLFIYAAGPGGFRPPFEGVRPIPLAWLRGDAARPGAFMGEAPRAEPTEGVLRMPGEGARAAGCGFDSSARGRTLDVCSSRVIHVFGFKSIMMLPDAFVLITLAGSQLL